MVTIEGLVAENLKVVVDDDEEEHVAKFEILIQGNVVADDIFSLSGNFCELDFVWLWRLEGERGN